MGPTLSSPDFVPARSVWCDCPDAPLYARGPSTLLDHPGGCQFPAGICTVRAHRVVVHEACGRELRIRFCACIPSGYTFDEERGWWVHYVCGWPTRSWFEASGQPAPDNLAAVKPATFYEYPVVPSVPKKAYSRLTEEEKRLNDAFVGAWVRD
jgi:hypothetical protein